MRALQVLDRAARRSSRVEILLERARTFDQVGDATAAGAAWTRVLQSDPKSVEALARLGRLAWERGAPAEAEGFLERAVAGGGHSAQWFDLGLVQPGHAQVRSRSRGLPAGAGEEPGRGGSRGESGHRPAGNG
ncbi:tetratricopeptide repeat protein [Mesorhizobium atlanticum]